MSDEQPVSTSPAVTPTSKYAVEVDPDSSTETATATTPSTQTKTRSMSKSLDAMLNLDHLESTNNGNRKTLKEKTQSRVQI